MQYKVVAYSAKIGSMIELEDNVTLAGVVYPASSNEMFIICLKPAEDKKLPIAEQEKEVEEEKASS